MKNIQVGKVVAIGLGLAMSVSTSFATSSYSFSASGVDSADGNALSASATFVVNGSDLQITLANTGSAASQPSDVLTILYFNLNGVPGGTPSLTPNSATLGAGSFLYNPGSSLDSGTLGGNWQYMNTSGPHGATAGLSTTGIGQFGPNGNFGTPTAPVDGAGYGIVNGVASNANTGVTGRTLVDNTIVFDLTLPTGYSITNITDVGFQYGTAANEPFIESGPPPTPSVPDGGSTALLLGSALAGVAALRKKMGKA